MKFRRHQAGRDASTRVLDEPFDHRPPINSVRGERQRVGFVCLASSQREFEFHRRLPLEARALAEPGDRGDGVEEAARARRHRAG
jgi:hypothetical protein